MMNTQALKERMSAFFAEVSPEYLVSEFEKMGYTFIETDVIWKSPAESYCHIERAVAIDQRSRFKRLLSCFSRNKIEKNLTPNYSGYFFV